MSDRLIAELQAAATKAESLASGYNMAGERNLAGLALNVANRARMAAEALTDLAQFQAEARAREVRS